MENIKYCSYCEADHPDTKEYWYISIKSNGKTLRQCKKKKNDKRHELYQRNHETIKAAERARYRANPEKAKNKREKSKEYNAAYGKEWRKNNPDKVYEYNQKRWTSRKEEMTQANKDYYVNNTKKINDQKKEYNQRVKEKTNARFNFRYKHDIHFRIRHILRSTLKRAIKKGYVRGMAINLLGCSIDDFKIYIASLFAEGMSWDNHGAWHLDHKKPLSSFDLTNLEQLAEASHYSNLQPLWAVDNLKKGSRI